MDGTSGDTAPATACAAREMIPPRFAGALRAGEGAAFFRAPADLTGALLRAEVLDEAREDFLAVRPDDFAAGRFAAFRAAFLTGFLAEDRFAVDFFAFALDFLAAFRAIPFPPRLIGR